MKNILVGMIANVLIFSSLFGSERVNSISELGNPDYIYEFAMDNPFYISGSWSVNMYQPSDGTNIIMWKSLGDNEQMFRFDGKLIRRDAPYYTHDYCLNAYSPGNLSNVTAWGCNTSDSDQYWTYKAVQSSGDMYVMFEANNSGYCLNAHSPYYNSNINLYKCNSSDLDQLFSVFREYNPE